MDDKEKVELREKQFEMAMNGDVRMLIWLGKQYLNQGENPQKTKDELCEGFDLQVIDDIVFNECDNDKCKCVDCRKEGHLAI